MTWNADETIRSDHRRHWLEPPVDEEDVPTELKRWVTDSYVWETGATRKEINITIKKTDALFNISINEHDSFG